MASSNWKAIERAVAALVSGTRTWNDEEHADVRTDDGVWAIEVKNRRNITGAQIEGWLQQARSNAGGALAAVVFKRKAGQGKKTPYIAAFQLDPPENEDRDFIIASEYADTLAEYQDQKGR